MDLVDVDHVGLQSPQTLLTLVRDAVRPRVLANDDVAALVVLLRPRVRTLVGIPAHAALRRQHHLVPPPPDRAGDQLLAVAEAVDRGRVDRGDAGVDAGADGVDRVAFVVAAPHPPADRPGAEDDRRDAHAGVAELPSFHDPKDSVA